MISTSRIFSSLVRVILLSGPISLLTSFAADKAGINDEAEKRIIQDRMDIFF